MADRISRSAEEVAARIGEALAGQPWVAVYRTADNRVQVAQPDGQDPRVAPRFLADAEHCLVCSGCPSCRP